MLKFTKNFRFILVGLAVIFCLSDTKAGEKLLNEIDSTNVTNFFDNYLKEKMSNHNIAGAVVSVVKDGEIMLKKGYGFSDVANQNSVDPDKSMFILASLSKVFTWTAVMQLVEQGKLDLNTDVNKYLDFKIPDTFPTSITINNLMSHNHGFEDVKYGQMASNPDEVVPLNEWLKNNIPTRVHSPGKYSAYGNYSAALAGYIIERISGISYDEYIEKNIIEPLMMDYTTSRIKTPEALKSYVSKCYLFDGGEYKSQELFSQLSPNVAPAASFKASAADMAKFMIAHLNYNNENLPKLLKPETAKKMHSQSFTHHPLVNGMAHGFWELDKNGQTIIGHSGSHFAFSSFIMLLPEQNMGVFISTNTRGGANFIGENFIVFQKAFMDRFFPIETNTPKTADDYVNRFNKYNGNFRYTHNRSDNTPEKLFAMLFSSDSKADQDGLDFSLPTGVSRFTEIEPNVFQEMGTTNKLVFSTDEQGDVKECYYSPLPLTALIKTQWYETLNFNLFIIGFCFILFLSVIVRSLIAFLNKKFREKYKEAPKIAKNIRWTELTISILSLWCLFIAFSTNFDIYNLYIGNLSLWSVTLPITIIVSLLMILMVFFTILGWKNRYWNLTGHIYNTTITIASISFVWFMYFWSFLGQSF